MSCSAVFDDVAKGTRILRCDPPVAARSKNVSVEQGTRHIATGEILEHLAGPLAAEANERIQLCLNEVDEAVHQRLVDARAVLVLCANNCLEVAGREMQYLLQVHCSIFEEQLKVGHDEQPRKE